MSEEAEDGGKGTNEGTGVRPQLVVHLPHLTSNHLRVPSRPALISTPFLRLAAEEEDDAEDLGLDEFEERSLLGSEE